MRTIVEEKWSAEALAQARETWSGADLAWDAVTWIVAHDPDGGDKVSESGQVRGRTLRGARSIFMPNITILYRIEPYQIVVLDVMFAEPERWDPNAEG